MMVLVGALAACGDDPMDVEFQVIEEAEFDASLNIDLPQMELLDNGVYRRDIVDGDGEQLVFGIFAMVRYTGWLNTGVEFDSGEFGFLMGNNEVVRGFEDGLLGMLVGGTRLIVVPPNLGYGALTVGIIPPGSILIFEAELISVN